MIMIIYFFVMNFIYFFIEILSNFYKFLTSFGAVFVSVFRLFLMCFFDENLIDFLSKKCRIFEHFLSIFFIIFSSFFWLIFLKKLTRKVVRLGRFYWKFGAYFWGVWGGRFGRFGGVKMIKIVDFQSKNRPNHGQKQLILTKNAFFSCFLGGRLLATP